MISWNTQPRFCFWAKTKSEVEDSGPVEELGLVIKVLGLARARSTKCDGDLGIF